MKSEFILAFNEIAETRKLPREVILDALRAALVSAYRRNAGGAAGQRVEARIDERTGEPTIWVEKEVVEEVANEQTEISLEKAREIDPEAEIGDMVMVEDTPRNFGRIAAQTAKQVILQRMREAEREAQYQEYLERVGDLVTGTVQSDSGGTVTIGLGRTEAILPRNQQIPGERYHIHDRVRAYVMEVRKDPRGPRIIVSRAHRNMLRRLLEYEVPEIYNGAVEIKAIAREPGARSKVAVAAIQEGADPVGACVGMRGVRIQNIVKELNNEKIDVIEWSPDPAVFISKALSPARVSSVFLDDDPDEGRTATVIVPDDQLSLAIGREGQNARLAAKLTGWRIDIKSITEGAEEALVHIQEPELAELAEAQAELVEQIQNIMRKREENRPIMPEDYQLMVKFINVVEGYRLNLREGARVERRAAIEAARAQVPPAAYEHPLSETDLPAEVREALEGAGYRTVGRMMEQYYLDPARFEEIAGFEPSMLEAIETLINTIEFAEPVAEEVAGEEVEAAEEAAETVEEAAEAEAVPEEPEEAAEEELVAGAPVAEPAAEGEEEAVVSEQPARAEPELDEEEARARAERAALVARMSALMGLEGAEEAATPVREETAPAEAAPEEPRPKKQHVRSLAETPAEPSGEDLLYEEEEDLDLALDFDEEDEASMDRKRAKQRRRELIYDEELGRVVARRKRKRRGRMQWDEYEDYKG